MGLYEKNSAIIARHFPALAEELRQADDFIATEDCRVETAASGAPTMVYKGVHVHSKHDPEREALRLVESAAAAKADGGKSPALILGIGLGYSAAVIAAKFPGRPIIIAEKRHALFKKALEYIDLQTLLKGNPLVFVIGGADGNTDGALSLFENSGETPPLVIQNRALTSIEEDREWYAGALEKIKFLDSKASINQATKRKFGKRWVRNLSKNLSAVRDLPGISRLEGLLSGSGIPVFLAAAGPTLDKAGSLLKEIRKRCLVVAVDTSLRFLLGYSTEPDFVVSVDPQYWNFRHLDRTSAPKTRLVAESAVYPACLRHAFSGIFLCGSFFPLGRFMEERVDPKGELGAGGSVATSAWDFIRRLGAKEVWTAGLDLSFPELKTHFRGALFEEKSHASTDRFDPAESRNFRALRDGLPFAAKRKGGGTVLTDKRLSLYAAWFENRFARFFETRNYCLSEEGLDIKGLEKGAAEALLALPERRPEIDNLLEKAHTALERDFFGEEAKAARAEKYEEAKKILVESLKEIKETAEEAWIGAEKAARRNRQGRLEKAEAEKALKKLDGANKTVAESGVKEIADFLFPETGNWEAEIAVKGSDPLTSHFEFSCRFYRALAETAEFNLRTISGQKR